MHAACRCWRVLLKWPSCACLHTEACRACSCPRHECISGLCVCSGWSGRRMRRQSARQHRLECSMATSPPAAMASPMRPKPAAAAAAAAAAQRKQH